MRTIRFGCVLPGQYFDGETGLHYNGARDYDPASGRFIESDPFGMMGGSNSLFVYSLADPIGNSDTTGQFVAPVLPGPTAAVTAAWYGGFGIGTGIYAAFGTPINDAIDRATARLQRGMSTDS